MSLRVKLLAWIVGVNLGITGLLLWSILSNIHVQSEGYRKNAKRFEEQREEIISRLENILVFQEQISNKELADISAATILKWEEWRYFRDAMVLLKFTELGGDIVYADIFINPLGKAHRTFDQDQAVEILKTSIKEDRMVLGHGDQGGENFYIAIPIHVQTEPSFDPMNPSDKQGRVWGGAIVQPRFPVMAPPEDYFDWKLFWVAILGGTLVMILVTYLILSEVVIQPVEEMALAADRVAHGDFSAYCQANGSGNEIDRLIFSFNYMLDEVRDYHQHLEEKVQEAQAKVKSAEQHLIIAQRLAATGQLAAGIAHEINNPIGGMINAALNLKEKKALTPDRADLYLDLITEGLGRIKDIVRKVLVFTPRTLAPERVSLMGLFEDTEAMLDYRIRKKNLTFKSRVVPEDLTVFCEPGEVRQVFLNLLINAIDAVEDTKGAIQLLGEKDLSHVVVRVIDNGCGMDEEEMGKVFDLFYTTKDSGEGTGLGLSLAHNIVSNHGGALEIQSKKGEGTSIRILLPDK